MLCIFCLFLVPEMGVPHSTFRKTITSRPAIYEQLLMRLFTGYSSRTYGSFCE